MTGSDVIISAVVSGISEDSVNSGTVVSSAVVPLIVVSSIVESMCTVPSALSDGNSVSLRPHDEEINKARIVRATMINFFICVFFLSVRFKNHRYFNAGGGHGIIQSEISSDIVA